MKDIKFFDAANNVPLEMHKVRTVQKLNLISPDARLDALTEAGNNTFLLQNADVFLDMLTDSGVNAMSDNQVAAMMQADDSYAGSATFTRLYNKLFEIFGMKYFLPAHQGRACENILAQVYVGPLKDKKPLVPMNYHFTTTKAHIGLNGGAVAELYAPEAVKVNSSHPFKGELDPDRLEKFIKENGADRIAFVRIESGTNLIGGQPHSLKNLKAIKKICEKYGKYLVYDASLLADNLYFIKVREPEYKDASIRQIAREIADNCDIIYFSARKLGCARGGGMLTNSVKIYDDLKNLVPLFEGFMTYGGMSVREMEAMAVGLEETMDYDMISQGPLFIDYMVKELDKKGVPVITPGGGLGCHLNAMKFVDHIPQSQYPAGALGSALFLVSAVRGMERGTISEERKADGSETFAELELLRLALPRRVFTLSQVKYAIDRICWLYENRKLVGGLEFYEEPPVLRFFLGKLKPVGDWQQKLLAKFKKDFGE